MHEFIISQTVDSKGTRCPIPLLRAKQALRTINQGEYLKVLATDPSAKSDFEAMLKHLPHELAGYQEQSQESSTVYEFIIRKG